MKAEWAGSYARTVIADLQPRYRAAAWHSWRRRAGELALVFPTTVMPWDAEEQRYHSLLEMTMALMESSLYAEVPPGRIRGL